MPGKARLFIAVPVSDEVRRAAARLREDLRAAGADFKWVEPEDFHITLRFLGATPLDRLPEIEALLRLGARRRPFEVSFSGVGAFASWADPSVVWVGVARGAGELAALAGSLGPPEQGRPFAAHLTIGRRRSRRGLDELRAAVEKAVFPELRQIVDRVVLFESRLTAEGSIYSVRRDEPFSE